MKTKIFINVFLQLIFEAFLTLSFDTLLDLSKKNEGQGYGNGRKSYDPLIFMILTFIFAFFIFVFEQYRPKTISNYSKKLWEIEIKNKNEKPINSSLFLREIIDPESCGFFLIDEINSKDSSFETLEQRILNRLRECDDEKTGGETHVNHPMIYPLYRKLQSSYCKKNSNRYSFYASSALAMLEFLVVFTAVDLLDLIRGDAQSWWSNALIGGISSATIGCFLWGLFAFSYYGPREKIFFDRLINGFFIIPPILFTSILSFVSFVVQSESSTHSDNVYFNYEDFEYIATFFVLYMSHSLQSLQDIKNYNAASLDFNDSNSKERWSNFFPSSNVINLDNNTTSNEEEMRLIN